MNLQLLMKLRPVMPTLLWQPLRNAYWRHYWKREENEERRQTGRTGLGPIAGSERAVLTETIADSYPFSSLLEVGCAYGQNFHSLAEEFSDVRFVGVDVEATRIREGQALLERRGFSSVTLLQGDGADLSQFADKSFDIVVTCACLLCVGPDKIDRVLSEMLRVCRKRLLLLEQHESLNPEGESSPCCKSLRRTDGTNYWVWDFEGLFKKVAAGTNITVTPIPSPRWHMESWQTSASLISVIP
jgi:SAM-dependent methyltransferase